MNYFAFPEQKDIDNEAKKQDPKFLEDIQKVGTSILTLVDKEELETLKEFCLEAWPLLKFVKERVYEAFMSAMYLKHEEIMEFFLKHGLNLKNEPMTEAIMGAIKIAKWVPEDPPVEILALLLKYGANPNYVDTAKFRTPVFYACKHGNLAFVKMLVESGADINAVDKNKKTPLNYVDEKIKANPDAGRYKELKEYLVSIGAKADWKY